MLKIADDDAHKLELGDGLRDAKLTAVVEECGSLDSARAIALLEHRSASVVAQSLKIAAGVKHGGAVSGG